MMTVRLIAHTPEPEKVVAAAAKLCYSDAHIEDLLDGLDAEKAARFLEMLSDLGHASPWNTPALPSALRGSAGRCWPRSPGTGLLLSASRASGTSGWTISAMWFPLKSRPSPRQRRLFSTA